MSTIVAKYVAISEAGKEMVWLNEIVEELGKKQHECDLFGDSQSVILLSKDPILHFRTNHIKR